MTKYFCDMCKSKIPDGAAPVQMRFDDKMHDLCNECYVALRDLLKGTGTPIAISPFPVLNGPLTNANGPFTNGNGPFTFPVTTPGSFGLWKDGIGDGISNGIQITYGMNTNSLISQAASSDLDAPGFKGILANLYVEPGSTLEDAIKAHFVKP